MNFTLGKGTCVSSAELSQHCYPQILVSHGIYEQCINNDGGIKRCNLKERTTSPHNMSGL